MGEAVVYTTKLYVRYQETDQMGVAHHSVYPVWFEVGRTEFIRDFGLPYSKMEADGLYLPIIGLTCEFKSFSRFEDELAINTRIANVTGSRLNFMYEVVNNERIIAIGTTAHTYANRQLKPVNLRKYMPEAYRLFLRIAGADPSPDSGHDAPSI